jgi:hypothetical protein
MSLRALGSRRRPLGLGARRVRPRAGLCAGAGRLHSVTGDSGARPGAGRCRTACRLVSLGARRDLLARLYPQPGLHTQRQYRQRQHHEDQHDYRGPARRRGPAAAGREPAIRKPSRGNRGAGAGSRRVRPGGTGSGSGFAASTSRGRRGDNTAGSATAGRDGVNRSSANFSTSIVPRSACNAASSRQCHRADTTRTLDRRSIHRAGADPSAGPAKFLAARPSAARRTHAGGHAKIASDRVERAGDLRGNSRAVGAGSLSISAQR